MTDEPTGTALVTVAVTTPAPLPPGFTVPGVAALARDLAIHLYDEDVTLKKHGITAEQFETLSAVSFFTRMLEAASLDWNSTKTINQRLALEAAVTLEEALPDIGARMKKSDEALSGVVEAGKLLAKVAGLGEAKTQAPPGEKFTITINLGADTLKYDKTRPRLVEVQSQPEGDSADVALP